MQASTGYTLAFHIHQTVVSVAQWINGASSADRRRRFVVNSRIARVVAPFSRGYYIIALPVPRFHFRALFPSPLGAADRRPHTYFGVVTPPGSRRVESSRTGPSRVRNTPTDGLHRRGSAYSLIGREQSRKVGSANLWLPDTQAFVHALIRGRRASIKKTQRLQSSCATLVHRVSIRISVSTAIQRTLGPRRVAGDARRHRRLRMSQTTNVEDRAIERAMESGAHCHKQQFGAANYC